MAACDDAGMSKKKARPIRPLGRSVRRNRRVELSNGTADIFEGGLLGPGMTRADEATILKAMNQIGPDRPWTNARSDVRPMLPRIRPYPFPVEPVRIMLPPGILVGFGIDIGPALAMVDGDQLARWGVGVETVADQALANVRGAADRCDPDLVVRESVDGVPLMALQTGVGIGASMLLVPERLNRFFGPGPLLLLAPMRDLLIALPAAVDREFAAWLAEEWESMDPNHLHLGGWLFESGAVCPVPIDEAFATA
jgi:hypothetical protein